MKEKQSVRVSTVLLTQAGGLEERCWRNSRRGMVGKGCEDTEGVRDDGWPGKWAVDE